MIVRTSSISVGKQRVYYSPMILINDDGSRVGAVISHRLVAVNLCGEVVNQSGDYSIKEHIIIIRSETGAMRVFQVEYYDEKTINVS